MTTDITTVRVIEVAQTDIVYVKITSARFVKEIQDHIQYKKYIGYFAQVVDAGDRWRVLKNGIQSRTSPCIFKEDAEVVTEQDIANVEIGVKILQ